MRNALLWAVQAALAVALVFFVGRSVFENWGELGAINVSLSVRPGWIALSALVVWCTYGLLIEAWRRVLAGWGQSLRFAPAARVWALSNLGRYLPGKIWSVAGLAVLAARAGIQGWAAVTAAIALQLIAVGTGALASAVGAPGAATTGLIVGALLVAGLAVLALAWQPLHRLLAGLFRKSGELRRLPPATVALATAIVLASWLAYGFAFWLLGRGLFDSPNLTILRSIGVFASGYLVGLLALFAPGGIGVRELVFVALLGPVVGTNGALALTVASRLLLTATEVGAALAVLGLRSGKETVDDGIAGAGS